MVIGQILDAPSEQWIDNRIADNGLVERITEGDAPVETADAPAVETAELPRGRGKRT